LHYGDPAKTSIKYECDFARFKPRADILVNGHACSPTGKPVEEVEVGLEIGDIRKRIRVVGNRHWELGLLGFRASRPEPFLKMPLMYERAFGGVDQTHENPKNHAAELRNPVGVGFHKNSDPKTVSDSPLPNLEDPKQAMRGWSDVSLPVGFGAVGRSWQPRIKHAGTYDQKWLDERFPFLPADFDEQYFQAAPADQQLPHLQGGETVRCTGMIEGGDFAFDIPVVTLYIEYRFHDRGESAAPVLDTVLIEPDDRRVTLTWRAAAVVTPKLHALREVRVSGVSRPAKAAVPKARFRSLSEMITWEQVIKHS
jgi:hypothetical protein